VSTAAVEDGTVAATAPVDGAADAIASAADGPSADASRTAAMATVEEAVVRAALNLACVCVSATLNLRPRLKP
jgi:hypothetical protein